MPSSSSSSASSSSDSMELAALAAASSALQIPVSSASNGKATLITIYPSELPQIMSNGENEIKAVLERELAPLPVWHNCALAFYRQGFTKEFSETLTFLTSQIEQDEDTKKAYINKTVNTGGSRVTFHGHLTEIYNSLAASALEGLVSLRDATFAAAHQEGEEVSRLKRDVVDYTRSAEDSSKQGDYEVGNGPEMSTHIIKGFYEIHEESYPTAEFHFKVVNQKASRAKTGSALKPYVFGAVIGLGIVAYARQKWQTALEFFVKALQENQGRPAPVRMAIAACCFKLEMFDKAASAAKKVLETDATNIDAIIMLALIEQVFALKDRANRIQHRSAAADYCNFALSMDPHCASALISLANHHFCTLRPLKADNGAAGCAACIDEHTVHVASSAAVNVTVGDEVHFDVSPPVLREVVHVEINAAAGLVVLTVKPPLPASAVGLTLSIKTKELGLVLSLARRAFEYTNLKQVKSESCYIEGRVYHAKGSIRDARASYEEALQHWPDMTLANFALGQIYISEVAVAPSQAGYLKALEYFEKVQKVNKDDKDSQAFVILLRGMLHHETATIEKLKEVAITFPYEIDLWLSQGGLRQKSPTEFGAALKCYTFALEALRKRAAANHPTLAAVFSNIAVLQHSLGRSVQAAESICAALAEAEKQPPVYDAATGASAVNPDFKNSVFEGVFYSWSEPLAEVKQAGADGAFVPTSGGAELLALLAPGDNVVIANILHIVEAVGPDSFTAASPVRKFPAETEGVGMHVRRKLPGHNFNPDTVTICFNFARILEDAGSVRAAHELYIELLKQHPSFSECYLRLSHIAHSMGRDDEASTWIARSLAVDADNMEALSTHGDMVYRSGKLEHAKRIYERMLKHDKDDPRPQVSLGNLYFHASNDFAKRDDQANRDTHLKTCYKFFHTVLTRDSKNVHAANGLGMVFTEKRLFDCAREVFQQARESSMLNDDMSTNLAHIHALQQRYVEAEHAYQANFKSITKTGRQVQPGTLSRLCESMAFAQYKHNCHEDSLKSMLRGLHQEPNHMCLKTWYNIAVVRNELATSMMLNRGPKSTKVVSDATNELRQAENIFHYLAAQSSAVAKASGYSKEQALRNEKHCIKEKDNFGKHLEVAREDEDRKFKQQRKQEEEHQERMQLKEEEKQRALEAAEQAKRDRQKAAEDRAKRLEEIKEKWEAVPASKKKKSKTVGDSDAGGTLEDSDDDDGLGFLDNVSLTSGSKTQLASEDADLFGDDGDVDDDDIFGDAPSKKRKVIDDGEDGGAVNDDVDALAKRSKQEEEAGQKEDDGDDLFA